MPVFYVTVRYKSNLKFNAFSIFKGYPKILGLDWNTLAGLRDASNMFLDYDDISFNMAFQ